MKIINNKMVKLSLVWTLLFSAVIPQNSVAGFSNIFSSIGKVKTYISKSVTSKFIIDFFEDIFRFGSVKLAEKGSVFRNSKNFKECIVKTGKVFLALIIFKLFIVLMLLLAWMPVFLTLPSSRKIDK